jgi:hypothetical protein
MRTTLLCSFVGNKMTCSAPLGTNVRLTASVHPQPTGSLFTTPVAVNDAANTDGHIQPFLAITYKDPALPPVRYI